MSSTMTTRAPELRPESRAAGEVSIPVVRVASVPAGHVYVRHLQPARKTTTAPPFRTLRDPDPADEARPAGAVWWPPAMLAPRWVQSHHREFDVFHVHFGFDAASPEQLEELVATLRHYDKPLIYTVHDLRNPHHLDPQLHERQLAVLLGAADEVITLTQGSAEVIARRWGRDAMVLPHPHVVPLGDMARLQAMGAERSSGPFTVGVHVKSLRPSMDPLPVIHGLRKVLRDLPGARLRVDGHRDLLESDGARYHAELAETLEAWSALGEIELSIHDFFTDEELWAYLASLDVSVLPYRFGTHSGWLEACHDLGTHVVAPACGFYEQQGPVSSYRWSDAGSEAPLDEDSLEAAIHGIYDHRRSVPASVAHRALQRDLVAAAHDRLYRDALGWSR